MFLFRNIYGYFLSVLLITNDMIFRNRTNVQCKRYDNLINIILPGQDFP